MSDEIKIERKEVMCPSCRHVFAHASTYKSEDYSLLQAERDQLRKLLGEARSWMHSDYCSDKCHPFCIELTAVIKGE